MSENDNDPAKPQHAAEDAPKARSCPICRKPRSERYDPFCSKRCADVDLHRWLKGVYVVPGVERGSVEPEDED